MYMFKFINKKKIIKINYFSFSLFCIYKFKYMFLNMLYIQNYSFYLEV